MALIINLNSEIEPGKGKAKHKKPNEDNFKDVPSGGCEVRLNNVNDQMHLKVDNAEKPPYCNLKLGAKNNEGCTFNLDIKYEGNGSDKVWRIKLTSLQLSPGNADPTVNVTMGEDKSS